MDVNLMFGIFKTTWYFWALVLAAGIYRMFRPAIKGFLGEKSVAAVLAGLDKKKYLVLHNILLQAGAKTTQIDHIVVSNYGVFVIETKNYKGWILGNEKDENWTRVIYRRRVIRFGRKPGISWRSRSILASLLQPGTFPSWHSVPQRI